MQNEMLKYINSDLDLEVYCDLLPLAYKIYLEKSDGMVCGSEAEKTRDKMFLAIKNIYFLDK